ncbi:MAG: hypothetical protein ACRYFS_08935 [Janthinobacterium lividum]
MKGSRTTSDWLLRTAKILPYLFLLGAAYSVFAETVDDPYITFRYAAHLLAGDGPVFNIGERVEGYTSPLHLLLSALLLKLAPSVDILFKAKCASLLFALVIVAQTGILARRSGLTDWEAVLAQTLVALNINFALAGVNALETTLYGCILLGTVLVFSREFRSGSGAVSGLLLFLAILARPEAGLVVTALLIVRYFQMRRRRYPLSFTLKWLGLFLIPFLIFEAIRWSYYGQPLPNTYYAKAQPLFQSLSSGLYYPLRSLSPTPIVFGTFFHQIHLLSVHNALAFHSLYQKNLRSDLFNLFMPLLFWALAVAGLLRTRHRIFGQVALAVLAAVLLFVLKAGGDWMYGWRFMAPIIPFLAVSQCHGIRTLGHRLAAQRQKQSLSLSLCGIVIAGLWLVSCAKTNHYSWKSAGFSEQGSRLLQASEGYGPLWVKGGEYIRHLPPGKTVAYSEMGYAGYVNLDKSLLDIRGLTDREIAHLPAQYKYSTGIADKDWYRPGDPLGQILEARKPEMIISFDSVPSGMTFSGYRRLPVLTMPTNGTVTSTSASVFKRIE